MLDAAVVLGSLIGQSIRTLGVQGRENTVLSLDGDNAFVATSRSPQGQPVPVADLQAALDRLGDGETVRIDPPSIGHRSSFLGAVLATLPCVEISIDSPPNARAAPSPLTSPDVLRELEYRLGAFVGLIRLGIESLPPAAVRHPGLYGRAG